MISRRTTLAGIGAGLLMPGLLGRASAAPSPIAVPITIDDRVLVACGINGAGPYFFMIDTGGTMSLIDNALASDLKLATFAAARIRGVGGAANTAVYRAHRLSIGGELDLADVAFNGIDGGGLGKDVRGTLAAGTVTGYDSVLDFDAGEWRIYPRGFGDLPGFTPVESTLAHDGNGAARIFVTVTVDGQPFRCMLDTGSPAEIVLYPEAARRTRYWDDPSVNYAPIRGRGIGGKDAIGRVVRAQAAAIGPITFDRPLVRLDGGARGQRSSDGIVGLPLIRQFNLAVDVDKRRVQVQPNHAPRFREAAPTSGLWVDRDGARLVVADVGRGSPAAKAGIVSGDVIGNATYGALMKALGSGAGANVTLTIIHDGQQRRATIALADYL